MKIPETLGHHLDHWLGAWPPARPTVTVVGSTHRESPGWDGRVRYVAGVSTPHGTIVSVPPDRVDAVRSLGDDLDTIGPGLPAAVGLDGWRFVRGVFRWSDSPAPSDDPGEWVSDDDPRVLPWLRPFNGGILLGLSDGKVAAGVGVKRHDRWGHELAVVTEARHRGRGWAKRLVCQAAHRVLADGAIPTYLHGPDNAASARTADACGFPDRGWQVLGVFPPR